MALMVGDAVRFEHVKWGLDFNGEPTVFRGWVVESATVTRVWERGPNVTLVTASGQVYVRDRRSESIWPQP